MKILPQHTPQNTALCLARAYRSAARSSDDPHTQTGAVIACAGDDEELYVNGANVFRSPGTVDRERVKVDKAYKYAEIEHAERHAIYKAGRRVFVEGSILYAPWACCTDCAGAIIFSGVGLVVTHKLVMDLTPDRWKQSIADAYIQLRGRGVLIECYEGPLKDLGEMDVLFDGKILNPLTGELRDV